MILWIILICIAILVLVGVRWWQLVIPVNGANLESEVDMKVGAEIEAEPIMHARCRENTPCGGDLICDLKCKRCKQPVHGDCAVDTDCETGLHCLNWKCIPTSDNHDLKEWVHDDSEPSTSDTHHVSWKATNEIFYI